MMQSFPCISPPDFLPIWKAVVLEQIWLLIYPGFRALLSAQVLGVPGNPSQIPAQAWESYFLHIVFSTISSILNYFGWEVGKKLPHVLLARFPFKTELFISDRFFQARKTCYISSSRGCFGILYFYDSIKLSVMRMNNSKNYS